jgi:hypothetical protein
MRVRLGLLWGLAAAALLPRAVSAEDALVSDPVALVRRHLLAQGASDVHEVARSFLFEGQASVHEAELERDQCVAFLALGIGEVRDVDVTLYARSGHPLADDLAQQPYAYARVCGKRGLAFYVDVTLRGGRGEVVLLRVSDAPRGVDRLPQEIRFAVSSGGRAERVRAVGAAPDELVLDLKLDQAARALAPLGYRAFAAATAMEVRAGTSEGALHLEGGRCYRIVAYVPVSRGVAFELTGPDGRKWDTRTAHDDRVDLPVCAQASGNYELRVQSRPMRSVAIVRAFEHPGASAPEIVALGDARALAWAEADVVARSRGFQLSPLGEAWVENSVAQHWPVTLEPGYCYVFAVATEDGAAGLDLRLVGQDGLLLARNEGRRGVPLVFACARGQERAHLMLRARGQDGLMSVWSGKTQTQGTP